MKPINLTQHEVRGLLTSTVSVLLRPVKPQPDFSPKKCEWYAPTKVDRHGEQYPGDDVFGFANEDRGWVCPFGPPGSLFYAREGFCIGWPTSSDGQWSVIRTGDHRDDDGAIFYRADGENPVDGPQRRWKPASQMQRWMSRFDLALTDVSVMRIGMSDLVWRLGVRIQ